LISAVFRDDVTTLPNLARFDLDIVSFSQFDKLACQVHAVMIDICTLEHVNRMIVALGVDATAHCATLSADKLTRALPPGTTLYRVGYARYVFLMRNEAALTRELAQRCLSSHCEPLQAHS
jgi:GGDEF domain-containing protein